ncbi:hypothetical protein [Geminicoccus flavidas]|uniref:hypothetical protein n=1 Tax=Geminicoccus flavidas TaxID=2506407 RepID=UPI00135C0CA2|nr:hypothetical protein [Geminicoccus flavidas]
MVRSRFSSLLVAIAGIGISMFAQPAPAAAAKALPVYYALKFNQTITGFEQCGLKPMPIVYPGALFKGGKQGQTPDYAQLRRKGAPTVRDAAAKTADKFVVLDVEGSWDLLPTDSAAVMTSKAADYYDLLHFLKQELKALKSSARVGYFRVAPPPFYESPASGKKTPYELGVAALKRVGNESDALFPQLYGYTTPANFRAYTNGTMKAARANWPKKPVYPFLWMQRRAAWDVAGGRYVHELLPKGAFALQLQTVKDSGADGVVIWGTLGNDKARLDWNGKADWWLETKAFLKKQGVDLKGCKL